MENKYFHIALLVGKYLAGDLNAEERVRLDQWLDLSAENRIWFERITTQAYQAEKSRAARQIDIEKGWQALQNKRVPAGKRLRINHWWYAGGVAAVLMVCLGTILLMKNTPQTLEAPRPLFSLTEVKVPTIVETCGDNVILSYDSLEVKQAQRIYVADTVRRAENTENVVSGSSLRFKTVVIPAGYTYEVLLADGSKVTLNAGSSLKFPEQFGDSVREVELTGEGYFEVAKASQPFIVGAGSTKVTVYGTRFNLFFSEKLQLSEAVLVEGCIGMKVDKEEIKIRPNQRISHFMDRHTMSVEEVEPADYLNWLNNTFKYNKVPLKRIVFDISQWYGIDIRLSPEVRQESYSLEFDKSVSVEWALEALKKIINKNIKQEGGVYYIE